jgi:hypothetical protein
VRKDLEIIIQAINSLKPAELSDEERAGIEQAMANYIFREEMSGAWDLHNLDSETVATERNFSLDNLAYDMKKAAHEYMIHKYCERRAWDGTPIFGTKVEVA